MKKFILIVIAICYFFETAKSQTSKVEFVAEIPSYNGISPDFIDDIIALKNSPNILIVGLQNIGARCGGGTPGAIWKVYLNPVTSECDSVVFKQKLDLIQQYRGKLFESFDGTLFTGSGWCGYKPPYFSPDYGETWTPATKGVHPPNSTFSYIEFNNNVYVGTGYNPYHAEVYKWLGNMGTNNWQKVFDYGIVRNILQSMITYKDQLFIASSLYEVSGCETSVPVYRSTNGIDFIPTTGIPACYSGIVLYELNNNLISCAIQNSDYYFYKWNNSLQVWDYLSMSNISDCNTFRIASSGKEIILYGRMGADSQNAFYTSKDATSWSKFCSFDSAYVWGLSYENNTLYFGTRYKPSIYKLNLNEIVRNDTSICKGDSVYVCGKYLKNTGIYYDTIKSGSSRDTIIITNLTIKDTYRLWLNKSICKGDSIWIHNKYRKLPGIYADSLKSICNCDSIVATSLTVNPSYTFYNDTAICKKDSILIAGKFRKYGGVFYENYRTIDNCDSIFIYKLAVDPLPLVDLDKSITFYLDGRIQFDAGAGFCDYLWSTGSNEQTIIVPYQGGEIIKVWVQVTDYNGCANSDTAIIDIVTKINQALPDNVVVYPNPSQGLINVKVKDYYAYEIKLINAIGKTIKYKTDKSDDMWRLDLRSHPKGIYYLLIKTMNGSNHIKLIIQ
jgi:hypothetical protein